MNILPATIDFFTVTTMKGNWKNLTISHNDQFSIIVTSILWWRFCNDKLKSLQIFSKMSKFFLILIVQWRYLKVILCSSWKIFRFICSEKKAIFNNRKNIGDYRFYKNNWRKFCNVFISFFNDEKKIIFSFSDRENSIFHFNTLQFTSPLTSFGLSIRQFFST